MALQKENDVSHSWTSSNARVHFFASRRLHVVFFFSNQFHLHFDVCAPDVRRVCVVRIVFVPSSSPATLLWSLGKLIYSLTLHILPIARCSLPLVFSKKLESLICCPFLEIVSLILFLFGNGAHVCNDIFCSFMLPYEIFILSFCHS